MKWLKGSKADILTDLATDQRSSNNQQQIIDQQVAAILKEVSETGDAAVVKFTETFDQVLLDDLEISAKTVDLALDLVEPEVISALEAAKANIISYHQQQKQVPFVDANRVGVIRGQLVIPLERVAVYVPGGTAAYPSSVLMNVLPAKIAGVKEIIMVTPPGKDGIPPVILSAAKIAGVDRIFQVGGAQAIAAVAYGTETIPQVDKIVGPGNIYVATAKKMVYGQVAIDMIAGPSEIGVIADENANPDYIAADLLSQAEHDVLARAILVTNDVKLGEKVEAAVAAQLKTLPRRAIAEAAIRDFGRIVLCNTTEEMFELMNAVAPEHLEVQVTDPMSYLGAIKNAGSIFLGEYASEPVGDYFAGTNHVLPTSGTARFFSPLGVYDFVKHSQFTYYTKEALQEDQKAITTLARKEGLEAHARAIDIRFEEEN
ncbi:histidinol dehydrogenase [Enterococcus sp. HY326]|uniref:histidinol dehydrogenase n=1 Tax=Enterococcus sp. HY326 TaxID=2971265 RepID=UPI0022407847|nr:histidinol dehydrogenase [Enterococcus sp. HY326]